MLKKISIHLTAVSVLLLLCIGLFALSSTGCRKIKLTDKELVLIEQFDPWAGYLEDYNIEHQYYPYTWDELVRWKSLTMPTNPYTGQPMVALESAEFDPAVSPGNFCYLRVIRDEQVVNCQLILFSKKGELVRYSHSPMAAR